MDYIHRIICIIFIFTVLSILGFRHKQKQAKRQRIESAQLHEDAQRYFVTICHKLLTPFGEEESASDYITFSIILNHLFVFRVTKNDQDKLEKKMLMSVRFTGARIVDQWTQKEYLYSTFENHLNTLVGDSLVYDSHIEHLWNEMHKKESIKEDV
jgi:hypothetical protein